MAVRIGFVALPYGIGSEGNSEKAAEMLTRVFDHGTVSNDVVQVLALRECRAQVTALRAQVTVLRAQVTVLRAQVTVLRAQVTVLRAQVTALRVHVTVLRLTVLRTHVTVGNVLHDCLVHTVTSTCVS